MMVTQSQEEQLPDNASNNAEDESILNCYFHVMQNFAKPHTSFVKAFKNKSLVNSDNNGEAYLQVVSIHYCKTNEQRTTAIRLMLEHWREEWNETAAANMFESSYGVFPKWNWHIGATGEIGCYATQCPNESLFRLAKASVTKNVGMARLLVETFPTLLGEDAAVRSDPCVIFHS